MWNFKGCPRCKGDIFIDSSEDGRWFEKCLQCGYERTLEKIAEPRKEPQVARKKDVKVAG